MSQTFDQFGENLGDQRALLNGERRLSAAFGEAAGLPLPAGFDHRAAKMAARYVAAHTSEREFDGLIAEHRNLAEKKVMKTATAAELRRLTYVRWNLDRIEDAMHGDELDSLELGTLRYEAFSERLSEFIEDLKKSTI